MQRVPLEPTEPALVHEHRALVVDRAVPGGRRPGCAEFLRMGPAAIIGGCWGRGNRPERRNATSLDRGPRSRPDARRHGTCGTDTRIIDDLERSAMNRHWEERMKIVVFMSVIIASLAAASTATAQI